MRVMLYAGSVRPGGGLTVARIIANRLLAETDASLLLVCGEADAAAVLRSAFESEPRVSLRRLGGGLPSAARGVLGKFLCALWSFGPGTRTIVSINFWMPGVCRTMVYHVNLLNFVQAQQDGLGKWLRDLDARTACRRSDVNFFESRYLLDVAQARVGQRIRGAEVMYVGVAAEFVARAACLRAAPGFPEPEPGKLVMISSIQPHKCNDTCVEALAVLVMSRPDIPWRLHVYGGQGREQWSLLVELAERLGVGDRIEVHGPVAKEELANSLSNAVCLLSGSMVESFAMVPLEAMACGCPGIVTNATSMPESLGEAAVLVAPGDAEAMAVAAVRMATVPEWRARLVAAGLDRIDAYSDERLSGVLAKALNAPRAMPRLAR